MVEPEVEETTLEWLDSLGCGYRSEPEIARGELVGELESYGQAILAGRQPGTSSRYRLPFGA